MTTLAPFVPPPGFLPDIWSPGVASMSPRQRRAHYRSISFTPFSRRSPRYQRREAILLAKKIHSDPLGRGVFTFNPLPPSPYKYPPRAALNHIGSVNVLFMKSGQRPTLFFNAYIRTVGTVLANLIVDQANHAINVMLSEQDAANYDGRVFSRPLPSGGFEMLFPPPIAYPSLGGLTRAGAKAAWLRSQWDNRADLCRISQSATLYHEYRNGIGLELITAQPDLSTDGILAAISTFRANRERKYTLAVESFANHAKIIDALLLDQLWHWDCAKAKPNGAKPPPLPQPAADLIRSLPAYAVG